MRAFVFAFALAALSTALLTPLVRRLALRVGAVSNPGGRNVNERSVPRLGGIAIAVGFLVPMVALFLVDSVVAATLRTDARKVAGLLAGALLLGAVGVLDDTRRLRAIHKLIAQVAAASMAYAAGYHIDAVHLPIIGVLNMGAFALPVTVVWIVGVVNAINLIDGLDGLAAGIAFFAGVTNLVVAIVLRDVFMAAMMATMLGAVLGFLVFNFNPARIFMGDSGSYFLGFILGTTSLSSAVQKASTAVSILVPVLALGVPIFDTLFTMLRRFLERRPIFSPDRGHIHHRLLDMGITHRRAVLILYGASLVFTAAALGVALGHSWLVGVAILVASAVLVGLVRFVGYFEYLLLMRRQRARLRSPETEALRKMVPQLAQLFEAPEDETEVFALLASVSETAELATVEVVEVGAKQPLHRWEAGRGTVEVSELVSARYPLGEDHLARADLRIRWRSTAGDVSPQMEILLQVLVDIFTSALVRVRSSMAPRSPEIPGDAAERVSRPAHVDV
jgi:UDP-GlcNAc:undecaprenyl-phosphate/decaprenyl-phosphate GlcNAc-1-phosphate transferase